MALSDSLRYRQRLLDAITDEGLEDLALRLLTDGYPDAHRVRGKDGGIDVLSDYETPPARGWQAKNYKEVPWGECRKSLAAAMAGDRPLDYTFVFPFVVTENQRDFWRDHFHPEQTKLYPDLELDDVDDLAERLEDRPDLVDVLADGAISGYIRTTLELPAVGFAVFELHLLVRPQRHDARRARRPIDDGREVAKADREIRRSAQENRAHPERFLHGGPAGDRVAVAPGRDSREQGTGAADDRAVVAGKIAVEAAFGPVTDDLSDPAFGSRRRGWAPPRREDRRRGLPRLELRIEVELEGSSGDEEDPALPDPRPRALPSRLWGQLQGGDPTLDLMRLAGATDGGGPVDLRADLGLTLGIDGERASDVLLPSGSPAPSVRPTGCPCGARASSRPRA